MASSGRLTGPKRHERKVMTMAEPMSAGEMSYAQLTALLLGKKLIQTSSLPDAACAGQLLAVSREMREALISLGLRSRRVRGKKETPKPATKKR
jgi:hypothetical protein